MTAAITTDPAEAGLPATLAARARRLLRIAAMRRTIQALAARHQAARQRAIFREMDDRILDDIGMQDRAPMPPAARPRCWMF
jgi:uncharacterized protein YjiS (DUF1127 family)